VFNPDFDPLAALQNINHNLQNLIVAHNLLAKRVEEQGQVIDVLTAGLQNSNRANELLLREVAKDIQIKLQDIP
jgi:hypothetical protein